MNLDRLAPAIFELAFNLKEINNLRAAILFGSAAKYEVHKKSDIDVLIIFDVDHNPEIGKESKIVTGLAGEIEKKYKLENHFSFVFINSKDAPDTDFLWQVAKDGIMLYGDPSIVLSRKEWFQPLVLFSYSLKNLKPKDKMYVTRRLYGYKVVKETKDKKYESSFEGLVNKHGKKIGRGVFIYDAHKSDAIIELFDKYGVKYSLKRIWY